MVFENPSAFWLLLIIIFVLLLGFWGWQIKKSILLVFHLNLGQGEKSQIKKYILAAIMVSIPILMLSSPKIPLAHFSNREKQGDIALMVDVSKSLAAQNNLYSPNRLERVKPILYEIIDEFPGVRFYPFHFTNIARSLTPPLAKEDFPYLKRSINRVLNINSAPGDGSQFGGTILHVLEKLPKEKKARIIVLFSDGEIFKKKGQAIEPEDPLLETALERAIKENVKIVTVGVGEKDGAKIPLYDQDGEFTGKFAENDDKIFITRLEEGTLRLIASKTHGKYFFEEDRKGIINFLNDNLEEVVVSRERDYQDVNYLLLIPFAIIWAAFARFYLK